MADLLIATPADAHDVTPTLRLLQKYCPFRHQWLLKQGTVPQVVPITR
jgi:hypothetical protein